MRNIHLRHVNYNVFRGQSERVKCNEKANLVQKVMRNVQVKHLNYICF